MRYYVINHAAVLAQTVLAFTICLLAKRGHLNEPHTLDLTMSTFQRQRLKDAEDTYRVSRMSARFVTPEVEAAFLKSRLDGMKKGVFVVYMILGVGCLVYQLQLKLSGQNGTEGKLIGRLAVGIVAIAIACATRIPFFGRFWGLTLD